MIFKKSDYKENLWICGTDWGLSGGTGTGAVLAAGLAVGMDFYPATFGLYFIFRSYALRFQPLEFIKCYKIIHSMKSGS